LDQLEDLGWVVKCPESLPSYEHFKNSDISESHKFLKNVKEVSDVTRHVAGLLKKVAKKGHMALTLGGDHSIAMGTVSASLSVYPDLGVIWVDAHADINTTETTDSGNLHGMPISFLMGLGEPVKEFEWLKPCLRRERIVYIALRDVDKGEKLILKENGIKAYSMHDVDKLGIAKVMEQCFEYLGQDTPIHLSFDVDALDPTVAPATGTPVRGGLTFREGHYICEEVFSTGRLVSMDMVEVNPELGETDICKKTTVNVIH
jgi:arginase